MAIDDEDNRSAQNVVMAQILVDRLALAPVLRLRMTCIQLIVGDTAKRGALSLLPLLLDDEFDGFEGHKAQAVLGVGTPNLQ